MLKLAGIFQDNMVIQRNKPIQVWGTGTPGTIVTVSLFTATADTMVCADGSWKIALQPLCAGAGYTLVASDTAESIVIQNVAVGEVWLAGGQSNMELALKDSENGIKISEEYSGKNIRFYQVPKCSMLDENQKEQEENSTWQIADNRNVGEMSAIAFYFASRLSETLHCIVGIIDCYWGGSSITCWMSREQLAKLESGKNYLENYAALVGEKSSQQYTKEMEEYNCAYQHWLKSTEEVKQKDPQASWKEIHKICGECPWPQPVGWQSPFRPNGLHETMIRRIAPYSLRGFLYYQGEEDVQRYADYSDMMLMLVKQWRMDWNDWNLPFLFVQLPMYLADGEKDDSYWALQREQQYIASMMIQNASMISLADCGEYDNIHPLDKKTPGERLFQLAKNLVYDKQGTITATAAQLFSDNGKLYVTFNHLHEKLVMQTANGCPFEISGEDNLFYPAKADVIHGNMLCISNPAVKFPSAVKYAWYNFGEAVLFTESGNPVSPFFKCV